jgi:hypothetical protein
MNGGRVLKLLKTSKLPHGVEFPAGTEIEIVMDVVYMGGYPLPFAMQATFLKWIKDNPTLFQDVTRKW